MDLVGNLSTRAEVTGPEAVLHSYQQLLQGFGKALQQKFHYLHPDWEICITSRFEGGDEENFPLQQVQWEAYGQQYDLEDQVRELCARIEDARLQLPQRAVRETCANRHGSTNTSSGLHASWYRTCLGCCAIQDRVPVAVEVSRFAGGWEGGGAVMKASILCEPGMANIRQGASRSVPGIPCSRGFDNVDSMCEGLPSELPRAPCSSISVRGNRTDHPVTTQQPAFSGCIPQQLCPHVNTRATDDHISHSLPDALPISIQAASIAAAVSDAPLSMHCSRHSTPAQPGGGHQTGATTVFNPRAVRNQLSATHCLNNGSQTQQPEAVPAASSSFVIGDMQHQDSGVLGMCQLDQARSLTIDVHQRHLPELAVQPAEAPSAADGACAHMYDAPAAGISCSASDAYAPPKPLSVRAIFRGVSGPSVTDGIEANMTVATSNSALPPCYGAEQAAPLPFEPQMVFGQRAAVSGDGPSTPRVHPVRSITCMGSAPAAVCRALEAPISCGPSAMHSTTTADCSERVHEQGAQQAMSADSYFEDLQQIVDFRDIAACTGPLGAYEAPQVGRATLPDCEQSRSVTAGTRTAQAPARIEVSAWRAPASRDAHTEVDTSAQMPGELGLSVAPRVRRVCDPSDSSLEPESVPQNSDIFLPFFDTECESADEAPIAPQPQGLSEPAGTTGRVAKQLQRRSAHHLHAAHQADVPGQTAGHHQDVQKSLDQQLQPLPLAAVPHAPRHASHASDQGAVAPQGSVAVQVQTRQVQPKRHTFTEQPQAEPAVRPVSCLAQQATTQQMPPSVPRRLTPSAQPQAALQAALQDPTGAHQLDIAGAAGGSQPSQEADAGPSRPRKRDRSHFNRTAGPAAAPDILSTHRFREPCSEHVEGVFPGQVAKRSRQGTSIPPLLQLEGGEEAELDLADGPFTVDRIQQVVEKRLQSAPGWRAQRRQVHLARAQRKDFRHFIQRILDNDPTLGECASRVLRLKPTLDLDTTTFEIDMVLEALRHNHRIEALYIHNFEQGFADAQLDRLMKVLRNGRIWACNIGENFLVTNDGWKRFLKDIPDTALAFTYVSEAHLRRTDLKVQMRAGIRINRILSPRRDPEVCQHISNMWFNPTGCKSRHYGCASEQDHNRRAASAVPLQQVMAERAHEVAAVTRAKAIYAKFISFRDSLLCTMVPAAARERALDPREVEPRQEPEALEVQEHDTVPVNVHLVPGLRPIWGPEHPRRRPFGPCSEIPGSVDVRDLPGAVREVMVPYAHLPASILQRCGSEVDGIEAEQEAAEQRQAVVASNERAAEVAAGIAARGLQALVYAVGSQSAQQLWVDEQRIRQGSPKDFSDDTMAWAVKCVGGHLGARREVEGGLSHLRGRRIDIFLPLFVQWVAAHVTDVDGAHVTVRFWCASLSSPIPDVHAA